MPIRSIHSLLCGCAAATFVASAAFAQERAPRATARTSAAPAQKSTEPAPDSLRLSRRQVIQVALQQNPQVDVAREQTAQARARRVSAVAVPDPYVSAGYDDLTQPFAFRGAGARPVSVDLAIPFPDKFRLNHRIGTADVRASESNFRFQLQSIALEASSAYDDLLVALQQRANLLESRELAADFLVRTQARFTAGTAARLDVIQAQVGVAQSQNDLIANERDIANAQAELNRILGRVTGATIVPTDSLAMPGDLPDSATIEATALANRPEIAIVHQQQVGAAASTSLLKEYWLPDLTFGVQRDYAQPGSPAFTTGISFPLPAFFWQHSRGDIAQAKHYERELAATYRDTRAQVTADVRTAYANASTAMRQVAFLQDELVPAAREAYRVSSTSYSLGGSSALEVLNARSALLQARSQLTDALAAANTARADLDRALGLPVASAGATDR